ncbi:MAG: ABC transporter permease [Dehalococcoidia bacterium]|nr:ABC transporter permease [Dehalococcoidia bacterium]
MREAQLTLEPTAALRPRRLGLGVRVRRHFMGVMGICILVFLGLTAAVGPLLIPHDPYSQDAASFERPSLDHPFGTDRLGRDVLSRVVHGARISLGIGFAAVTIGVIGGSLLGVISAYYGGWIDYLLQRLVEVVLAFPLLVLLLVIVAAVGQSIQNVILIMGVVMTPIMSRIVRSIVFSEKEQPYIEAARALGATNTRVLFVHLFPSVLPLALILASLTLGGMILAEASLSFLGLGVPPPNPSWGADMSGNARDYFQQAPWLAIFPGLALSLTILGANLVAEAVRDVIDPFAKQMAAGR